MNKNIAVPLLGLFDNDDRNSAHGTDVSVRDGVEEARQDLRISPLRQRLPNLPLV
jgi:hypothetical protein